MDLATALQAVEAWPVEDRIEFVQRVWDRIVESGWQPELTDEQKAELDRRLQAHEANPGDGVTWEAIVAHVRRRR